MILTRKMINEMRQYSRIDECLEPKLSDSGEFRRITPLRSMICCSIAYKACKTSPARRM